MLSNLLLKMQRGYPMKAAVTIDKRTGEFIDYIDDRSDEDKERHPTC